MQDLDWCEECERTIEPLLHNMIKRGESDRGGPVDFIFTNIPKLPSGPSCHHLITCSVQHISSQSPIDSIYPLIFSFAAAIVPPLSTLHYFLHDPSKCPDIQQLRLKSACSSCRHTLHTSTIHTSLRALTIPPASPLSTHLNHTNNNLPQQRLVTRGHQCHSQYYPLQPLYPASPALE